ncbi:MAG: chromosomal replication initiator protein DnaA, partial [Arenibacter algicola]|nr:chromosomal replication initiator protein DnaA [Arenibacter algicola]
MSGAMIDAHVAAQWDDVLSSLRDEIGEAAFQSWLKPMTVREVADGNVRISVPTRFMKDWVVAHYVERISELWCGVNDTVRDVEIVVQADYGQGDGRVASQGGASVTAQGAGRTVAENAGLADVVEASKPTQPLAGGAPGLAQP